MPIGTKPTAQTLILPLGIDIPRAHKHSSLLVVGEFILTRAYLFVDPSISYFGRGFAIADASVLGFFVEGAGGYDYSFFGVLGRGVVGSVC